MNSGADGDVEPGRTIKRRKTMWVHKLGRPLPGFLQQPRRLRPNNRILLEKFGMKKLEGIKTEVQQYKVRPYGDRHMSPHDAIFPITGYGETKMVLGWFAQLSPSIKEKVRNAGFEDLLHEIQPAVVDGPLIQALASKWWDTTHTFHFTHIGELTMTPMDFSAITGLAVSGIPLFLKRGIHREKKVLQRLLGGAICGWNTKRVPVQWLYNTYTTINCVCEADEDIVARAFILALLGATLFARPSMTVDLDWLRLLSDVRSIGRYNWGAGALAFLYNQMDDISRRNTFKIGGLWHAWEIWAREYLNIIPFILPTKRSRIFPASKKWNLLHKPDEDPTIRLQYYTIKLENIFTDSINWNPWGNEKTLPTYVALSMDASGKRILLIHPNGSAWYVGERVLIQSVGIVGAYVPRDPPVSMLQPRRLSIRMNMVAVRGQCAHTLVVNVHNTGDGFNLRNSEVEERKPSQLVGQDCADIGGAVTEFCDRNDEGTTSTSTPILRTGMHPLEDQVMELQTLQFPTHMKQVPVSTASKLLEVVGALQIFIMEAVQNADNKLRETACTVAGLRDELGLQTTTRLSGSGSRREHDSNTTMEQLT